MHVLLDASFQICYQKGPDLLISQYFMQSSRIVIIYLEFVNN